MIRPEYLKRERISRLLTAIYDYPLTILEAPMGFGKTTAVRSFLKEEKNCQLWIAFMNSSGTQSSFWNKFTSELKKIDRDASVKLKSLGFPNDVPQTEKVLQIMNDIAFEKKSVMVLDDFHLAADTGIARLLMQIVAERIDNLSIVVITRDTTRLEFVELMSKGLCNLLSRQTIKFNEAETNEYCRLMNASIQEADLKNIRSYADGWISLIYMILLGLDNGIPVGMSNSIEELVDTVIIQGYDEIIQRFLRKLGVMEAFTAEQAEFVTQEQNADRILRKLHKENAFVFYDQAANTYKIHNVLLDFLRIKQPLSSIELHTLYRRLGEWYLKRGEFPAAYSYFYKAGDIERILTHLDQPENINNELSGFDGSYAMFSSLPDEVLHKYPIAYLQHILLSIFKGDENAATDGARRLENLRRAIEALVEIDEEYKNHILAEILIIKRFTTFNNINSTNSCNDEILKLLNGQQSYIMSRENEFTMGSPHLLYVYFRDQGSLHQLTKLAIERFTTYASFANGCGTGSDYLLQAEYALETGDWEAAELNSFRAIYKARTKDQISIIICANFSLIRLYILQGKLSEAIEMLKQLENDVTALNYSIHNTTIDMCKGYIYACLNQPEHIPLWLQTGNMSSADLLYQGVAFNYIVYGKAVLLSKNYIELEILTESLNERFSIFNNQLGFIHNRILEAIAKSKLYGIDAGIASLTIALSNGEADHLILPFAEYAPYISELLTVITERNPGNEYLGKMLLSCEQYKKSIDNRKMNRVVLSRREIEVLTLTAEGFKREEIAGRLYLSEGTIKTHLKNIYLKLEVSGKVSAIKKAQLQGII